MAATSKNTEEKFVKEIAQKFEKQFEPHEASALHILQDARTGAHYCECHIRANKLVGLATIDAPLDPAQPGFKANRDILANAPAFLQMQKDAKAGRTFSNIVAEYGRAWEVFFY